MYVPLGLLYVVVTDPQVAKHILQTNSKNYIRPPFAGMGVFRRLVGQSSILLSNGDAHRNQRALATPAFTPSNIRQLTPVMVEFGQKLVDRLTAICTSGLIDVKRELSKCTLDIIGKAGFGYDFDCISSTDDSDRVSTVVQTVMDYAAGLRLWYFLPYSDWLPIRANRICNAGIRQLHGIVERMIDERTEALLGRQKECKNLLDMMIAGGSEKALDRANLRDQLMTFLMAGHETSSLALTYTLYFLSKHPKWQEECRNEIRGLGDADLTYEVCESLKRTKAVIFESLRLLPPVFALARQAVENDQLGPYSIPAGTNVAVLVPQMQRSPAYWGPDADAFEPERFLEEEQNQHVPWDAYMPFGEGARKCVGYKFALHEITVLLVLLIKNFAFRLDPLEVDKEMEFFGVVTMLPVRPICLSLKKL